jgi:hypothetical protein
LLEIGKYDILKGTPLSMRPLLRNIAFEGIDLDRVLNDPANVEEVCKGSSSLLLRQNTCTVSCAQLGELLLYDMFSKMCLYVKTIPSNVPVHVKSLWGHEV